VFSLIITPEASSEGQTLLIARPYGALPFYRMWRSGHLAGVIR
jgi:hypothetical protein